MLIDLYFFFFLTFLRINRLEQFIRNDDILGKKEGERKIVEYAIARLSLFAIAVSQTTAGHE